MRARSTVISRIRCSTKGLLVFIHSFQFQTQKCAYYGLTSGFYLLYSLTLRASLLFSRTRKDDGYSKVAEDVPVLNPFKVVQDGEPLFLRQKRRRYDSASY